MRSNSSALNNKLNHLLQRGHEKCLIFPKLQFFHILKDINTEADTQDNKAYQLDEGDTVVH